MIDHFTKWPECAALQLPTTVNMCKPLVRQVITRHGVPAYLQSDRGAQFTSQVFAEISRMMGMHQKFSSVYRPQTQGLIESWSRTIVQMLRQYIATKPKGLGPVPGPY